MIPQKPGQTPEDRAKDIDNVLTWLRSDGVDLTKDYSPEAFKKIANIRIPDGRTPDQKANDVEGILKWVRNPKNNERPETAPFEKVDQLLPPTPGRSLEDRAKDIDSVLTWLRNHGVNDSPEKSEPFKKVHLFQVGGTGLVLGSCKSSRWSICVR
jgi:hypothetical protein